MLGEGQFAFTPSPPHQVPRAGDKNNYLTYHRSCCFCLLPFEPTKDAARQTDSVRASRSTNSGPMWDPLRVSVFLLSTLAPPALSHSLSLFLSSASVVPNRARDSVAGIIICSFLFLNCQTFWYYWVFFFFVCVLLWCTCFVCLRNFEKKRSKTAWCERKKKRPAAERCCRGCSLVVLLGRFSAGLPLQFSCRSDLRFH